MRRGEFRWSALPGRDGKRKKQALLVVSEDAFNQNDDYDKVLVVAMASERHLGGPYPWEVEIPRSLVKSVKAGVVKCQEIFTLRKEHVGEGIAMLPPDSLEEVDRALALSLGITLAPRTRS